MLPWALLPVAALFIVPLTRRPSMEIVLIGAAIIASTASISVAVPLGLGGLPAVIVTLVGHDPFPNKGVPLIEFAWVVLAVAFTVARGSLPSLRGAFSSPLVLASLGLFSLLLIRLPASTDAAYGDLKVELFIIGNLTLLATGVVLSTRSKDIELFLILTLIIDALSAVLVLRQLGGSSASTDRFGLVQQNVIALGIQGAEGLMVATYFLLKGTQRWQRVLAACVMPLSLVALLASGSRGPVLGGAAGLLAVLVLLSRSRQTAMRLLVVVAFLAISFTAVSRLVPSAAVHRSLGAISGTRSGLASNGRNQLWAAGWHTFVSHPFAGVGTGSFATVARREVCPGPGCEDKYPHNVLLETAAELGIAGALFMIAVLFSAASLIIKVWRRGGREGEQASIVFGLFVSATVTAMLTGDLAGDGTIWLAGGIALGLSLGAARGPAQRASS